MIRSASFTSADSPHRTGATLVEVLMALLIMAIGVTSVFTLFPLAILRAVKANQLTNSKLYEGSIKDLLLGNPQLWTGAPQWSEQTVYGQLPPAVPFPLNISSEIPSRWVTPKASERLFPDTNLLFYYDGASSELSLPYSPPFNGVSNWSANTFDGGYLNRPTGQAPVPDGSLNWVPYRHSPYLKNRSWSAYLVDPLGWHRQDALSIDRYQFGRLYADTSGSSKYLDRIHCQLSPDAANQFFRLQDSWSEAVETTPVTVSIPAANQLEIVFPNTMDVRGLTNLNRMVFTSTLNPRAVELPVSNPNFTDPNNPNSTLRIDGVLPSGFLPDQVRIDVQAPTRYSWLMAVHSSPRGEFEAQCAIVFNRTFQTLDEQGYRAEFCQTEDLNNDGDVADPGEDTLWPNGRNDVNMAKVRWPYNADSESPRLKEGGFIFDASHGYWYQIQKIEVNEERFDPNTHLPDVNGSHARSIVRLGDAVNVPTGKLGDPDAFRDYLLDDITNDCQAVIIPGVIHVFPFAP
ncbi:MAG: hypothetical protein DWH81_11150 [Planctomycetota bacterium]|nr:MAG: hypothetical protein DWH81_11150 [Planctomycetota bacterium]